MLKKLLNFLTGSRLRTKFTLSFIVLASLPILILGGVTLYLIDTAHRQDVSSFELQLIDQKIEEIKKFFADTLGILELRVGFTQKSDIELSQQQFLLSGILEENRAFEEVSFLSLKGQETAKKSRTEEGLELVDVSRLPKFEVAARGDNFIGAVYYTFSGPFVTLAAPVRNRNGDIIQILSADVNLSQLIRSIEASRLGNSGYLLLLDKDGILINRRGDKGKPGTDLSGGERIKRVLGGEVLDALDVRDRYQSLLDDTAVVGAGKRISNIGWVVLVEWPLVDADALVRDIRDQVIRFTLFSTIAVLLLAPFFADRLLKPIRMLEAGAAEIEMGNLEKRVEIKTKDELEDLGTAFNKMAQGLKRLQELQNEFVFIAAHELRTPVTAIKGYLSMIREGSAGVISTTLQKYLDPVWQSNERLIQLVNDVLEIARSEAGRLKVEVQPYDLRDAVRAILVEIKPLADQKKITVSYEEISLPEVLADSGRVKEVIMNFVSNAIKYNRDGGWIKVYHETSKDGVTTHVEDNGFGMSEDDQKHVFEKFFRAEAVEIKTIQGTGLGLFITKELVEKMNGKIWFRSEEGKGTRFSFELPIAPTKS